MCVEKASGLEMVQPKFMHRYQAAKRASERSTTVLSIGHRAQFSKIIDI